MLNESQKKRVEYILNECDVPTYETDAFKDIGLETFKVFRGVLPPDLTITSPAFAKFLHDNSTLYWDKRVLELGSGTGILSAVIAKQGAKSVIATDILEACVQNTRENAERLGLSDIMDVRKGDLFEPIKEERFDLIVFAHPIYCDQPTGDSGLEIAIMDDGGLIRRFLTEAKTYLTPEGRLLLPFNEGAGEGNHPHTHAENYGFDIKKVATLGPEDSNLSLFELTPN